MGRAEDVDPVRSGATGGLHERMRRAARGLSQDGDLQVQLGHLWRVLGAGTGVERVVLLAEVDGHVHVLAAQPRPAVTLEAHAHVDRIVGEVLQHGVERRREGGRPHGATAVAAEEAARSRYGVPLLAEDAPVAVLVGESVPASPLRPEDEVALEAMAVLLTPLVLVRRQLEAIREIEALRSDFISRISHELRTPLTIITGFAGTLGAHEESLTADQRHAMLDRIVTASVRLEHLVEEVLSLASVEAGLSDPQPKLVPVRDVVDLAVHDRGGSSRVEVRGPTGLKVFTDPEVARVVLGPVVENALQQGERITVEIESVGDGVRVAVEDDGPGVPPELAPRVFERFVRGDDRSPGMGLGLAIARRMAETIGARIWLDDVDQGARFVVELPSMHR